MSIRNFIRNTMQRYSDFLEHRTQYNENIPAFSTHLSSPSNAPHGYQRGEPASAASAPADPPRKVPELDKFAPPTAAAPTSTPLADAGATPAQSTYKRSKYDPGPTEPAGYVPAHRPPSRGWRGVLDNVRAGFRGAASSAYTVPQAFKSAAFGSDEETRMAAQNPRWKGAYGGATGSSIRAYRVADEDLAQAEMRELESLKASTRDRVFQTVLAYTIKELQKESQARLKALTDKDMAARKENPFDIKKPKNDAPDDGYYDHNQWYYNDDVIILDEGWGRDFYRHAASAGAGIGSFLKGVVPRTLGGFTGWDTEKVRGPYKDSKAYGGFMGAVQQSRNAAQKSLDMANIRAAESIVSRSSHPLVIRQLVSFIRAKKGLKGSEKSIATANAYLSKITQGKKTSWRTLEEMPEGPYDSGSINDIIRKQTGVAPAGPAAAGPAAGGPAAAGGGDINRTSNSLTSIEDYTKPVSPNVVGREMEKVSKGDFSGFPKEAHLEIEEEWNKIKDLSNQATKHQRFAYLMRYHNNLSKNESRNYSRSLESIYNESFLDSIGKGIKSGYDYMTGSQKKQDKVPQEMTENQRKIYNAMLDINKMSADQYESMSEKNKAKAFRYAMDQVCDINGIPHINWLINMNDEDKIIAWKNARRRFNPILSSLGY